MIFDFETEAETSGWSDLALPRQKEKEPPIKAERVRAHATSGKHSLKLTFAGGTWPTLTTTRVPADWTAWQTFRADVTVSRPCVVGFAVLQEKSQRGGEWEALISRWTSTAFLKPGKNEVAAALPQPNNYAVHAKWGKVVRFEIFLYRPRDGETIYVDNVRLSKAKLSPPAPTTFTVAGTDWAFSGTSSAQAVIALGKKLKGEWRAPKPRTVERVEADFRGRFDELKKKHPKAVLAVLRDGEKGYDPAHPDRVYDGWKDAYWNSHGPDSNFADRAANRGKAESHEIFMRHRSPLMRADLSSIPRGAKILAAQLIIVRANDRIRDDHDPSRKPTMWVVEPCNRPWDEHEVNAFEYARGRFWKAVGGMDWGGDDPDFWPTFLAYGPGTGKVNVWDFTEAVRYWTGGGHGNHGFMLHGDSHDYLIGHAREAKALKDRPAVLVAYEPR
jgi:hypothetical protein